MGKQPTAAQLADLRLKTGLSPETCASLVYASRATWYRWESYGGMPPAVWELFQIKIGIPLVF